MATSFSKHLDMGWGRTPKVMRGAAMNSWGARMLELAAELDACEMSDEARDLVAKVFEESAYLLSSSFHG